MSKRNGSNGHHRQPQDEQLMKFPVPGYYKYAAAGVKIVVGLPLERNVSHIPFMHFMEMQARGCWPTFKRFYSRTDVNRNEFGRMLLESDYTHLAMLDTDHLHAPDVIEKMARHVVQDPEKLVIGGLHFRRGQPFEPCVFFKTPDDDLYHAPAEWPRALMKVDILGHGTILISRKVFEQIEGPWWQYRYKPFVEGVKAVYPSEDVYFSELCTAHGIKLWCDTTLTSPHQTESWVDEETFRAYLAEHEHAITNVQAEGVREPAEPAPEMPGIPEVVS